MNLCAKDLLKDIAEIQNTEDPDSPMLISLSIQCWLADGGFLNTLTEALAANNIQHQYKPPILVVDFEELSVRVPVLPL